MLVYKGKYQSEMDDLMVPSGKKNRKAIEHGHLVR